jgi:hypothetical protein
LSTENCAKEGKKGEERKKDLDKGQEGMNIFLDKSVETNTQVRRRYKPSSCNYQTKTTTIKLST